jgi:hypothetical protein
MTPRPRQGQPDLPLTRWLRDVPHPNHHQRGQRHQKLSHLCGQAAMNRQRSLIMFIFRSLLIALPIAACGGISSGDIVVRSDGGNADATSVSKDGGTVVNADAVQREASAVSRPVPMSASFAIRSAV